jgi:hypothetical protein
VHAIVIGEFSGLKRAARAIEKLHKSCVSDDRVRTRLLKPISQHPTHTAGTALEKPSYSKSDHSAAAQYAATRSGSNQIGDAERRSSDRPAGILVAVETPNRVSRYLTVSIFCEHGARIVENDAGCSRDKNWSDSDPISLSIR